ncbi:TAFII55 protein conserved region-domain-containing protein [Phascolomyces articulosus]|uniref:TAFII55 protein conserved region-domain-containing protein n=1 Tax=Phascolomyces articulosus TaxID=60185 RepID=A0AAD5JZ07_9FUNG|nr:TAFII55 protein conserved region-domain-containing protein [Phascolomyces articulosus]
MDSVATTIPASTTTTKPEKPEKGKGKRSRKSGDSKPIKIKLTTKKNNQSGASSSLAAANADGNTNGGQSGSEDEDEPEAAIEEHLILRLPQGEMCEQLRECVRKREVPEDVKLQMKDSRRGQFSLGGRKYDTTLVDLPTIIESQKTFDKKQFYKTADISQMLLVDDGTVPSEEPNMRSGDPYVFQHGLTPPLKHVRRRRFRKKLSKRAIEEVEQEVERLLEVDAQAEDVQYEVFDNRELEMENESDVGTQDIDIDMSEAGSESDDDLAAAIDRDLEELDEDDRDEDNEEEEEEEEEEDSDEEEDDDERGDTGEIEQKRQEIAEIKQAIQRKTDNLKSAPNAMLKKRFEDELEKLKKELALKEAYLAEMNKEMNKQKEQQS